MKKIGLVFDSACGITKEEADALGVGFIPLNITINDKEHRAGIDVTREELYEIMSNRNTTIKTSSPTGENIQSALDDMLSKYEKVIYIGISHKWSGTQNAIKNVVDNFEKYKDKVFIYPSLYSSPWIGLFIKDALELIEEYENPEDFFEILDYASKYIVAYLCPGDIWWFYKGGRITKMQYYLGSIAKIYPILKMEDGAIDQNGAIKTRGIEKAMSKMIDGIKNDISKLNNLPNNLYKIIALKTNDNSLLNKLINEIEIGLAIPREQIIVDQLSTEQIAHMGPNSFGLGLYVSLKNIVKAKLR